MNRPPRTREKPRKTPFTGGNPTTSRNIPVNPAHSSLNCHLTGVHQVAAKRLSAKVQINGRERAGQDQETGDV